MKHRCSSVFLTGACLLAFAGPCSQKAWAACNLIPQTEKTFDSIRGATTRPFAAPGEPIDVRLRPCDAPVPAISSSATDHLVTVVFTPTGFGSANAVILTAAADCSAVTPLLSACEAQLGPGGNAECVAGATAGMQVVARNATNYLRFSFPDSSAVLGTSLAGPAAIAVTSSTPGSLPCQLATTSCSAQSGLVACIDDYFAGDGACGRGSLQGTFNHFTALPEPNDFKAACWDPSPLCTASASQFQMATDADGNLLVPMDWRGILVKQNQVPVPRLLTATLSSPLPLLGIRIPGKSFVASYTPEGGLLPPIFEPESGTSVPPGVAALFGSADAPYTVLRLARRSDTYQQCSSGTNAGLPCNEATDCPSGSCGPTVCFGGGRNGLSCGSDGSCPGGECGPEMADFRALGTNGNGPVVLARFGAGVCQEDQPIAACTADPQCAMGSGTCVGFALTAENPVPLEGLALSPLVFAFALNEAIDNVPRNNDGDTIDTVATLRNRATGAEQPLGAPPPACGIPSNPVPEGRSVVRTQQAPFSFPALATDGKDVALLESEATTNNPTPPNLPCDMNGDGDAADAILRVFKLGSGEIAPSAPNPVASGDLMINGRALAVSNGRVLFRTSEQEEGAQHTTRVSLGPTGMQLNNLSGGFYTPNLPVVSYDGRYVVFDAYDDAVTNDPPSGVTHHLVFRDVKAGTNQLLNINASNQVSPSCFDQSLSADGRWAAFVCSTTNLLPLSYPSCTNLLYGTTNCEQVFLRDNCVSNGVPVVPCTPGLELVTADSLGNPGTDHAEAPSVSADGRYVAFVTWAPNLIGTTTTCSSKLYNSGTCPEIVLRDRCRSNGQPISGCTPSNTVVSIATDGTRTNQRSEGPILSANGRAVAFTTRANNLSPADASTSDSVYVHDLDTGFTELVSTDSFGQSSNNYAWTPSLSADGRFVSFSSLADNLVPGDTTSWDTFVHDRLTGVTERVSVNSNGVQQDGGMGGSDGGQLSADGRFVLFGTGDGNLVPGVSAGIWHAYVRDRATGTTKLVDVNDAGVPGDLRQSGTAAYISGDGRYAVFASFATNLVSGDTNTSCDYANDGMAPFENCSDLFYRGLGLNSASGDLSGDNEADDTVLRAMNTGSGAITTLCPAKQVSVVGGAAAFLRPESAGTTSNAGCTGATLSGPNLNGPPDADTDDDVVHFVSITNAVQNLGVAASAVALSGLCSSGAKAGQPCIDDTSCPETSTAQGTCAPTYVAALVSESGQNATELNGDGDATPNDDVLHVYDLSAGSPAWTNVRQAGDAVDAVGTLVAFITPEASQNADLNGDGDKNDRVLQVYDAKSKTRVNTGLAAEELVIGGDLDVCTTTPMVAFRSPEAARCTVPLDQTTCHNLPPGCSPSRCDLNGDGDCCDSVLFTYAKGTGVLSTGQAVTPCRLEACDPRLPYRVFGATVKFLTYEVEQNQILNGDGDAIDLVLQQYDACKKERKVISAIAPPGVCSVSGTACDSADKCPPGERCVAQAGGGAQKDPTVENPHDEGNIVITSSKRCYANTTLLLVPATCQTLSDCPANATACVDELIVAAPGAVPHHDTVLAPAKPVNVTIAAGKIEATKTIRLKVRNGDVLPAKEKIGHTVRLSIEPGDCPPLTVEGIDFNARTNGDQDSTVLTGGKSGVAKVRLRVKSADFPGHHAGTPARCTLTVRAATLLLDNEDPTPRNNVQRLELNVIDRNPGSAAVHESAIQSAVPTKLKIGENGSPVTKTVLVKLVNGDQGEAAGHDVTLGVDLGDCPSGTVAVVAPSTVTVPGGASARAKVTVSVDPAGFTAANAISLGRCTATLSATTNVAANVEPDASNNTTHLLIEVKDATDY